MGISLMPRRPSCSCPSTHLPLPIVLCGIEREEAEQSVGMSKHVVGDILIIDPQTR